MQGSVDSVQLSVLAWNLHIMLLLCGFSPCCLKSSPRRRPCSLRCSEITTEESLNRSLITRYKSQLLVAPEKKGAQDKKKKEKKLATETPDKQPSIRECVIRMVVMPARKFPKQSVS